MELFFIVWVCIAHVIFIVNALRTVNSVEDSNLAIIYSTAISWPLLIITYIGIFIIGLLITILEKLSRVGSYLTDIYWDYDIFMSYMLQNIIDYRKKP